MRGGLVAFVLVIVRELRAPDGAAVGRTD